MGIVEPSDKFINQLKKEKTIEKEIISNILNDSQYMDGLVKRIENESYVFDNNSDKNGINNLSILYKIVDNYARKNEFYPISNNGCSIYYVEYCNSVFSIYKRIVDNKVTYGCFANYINKDKLPYYIMFSDIKNNKMVDVTNFTEGLISQLKDTIVGLNNEGLSLFFIQQLVDGIIENLENDNKNSKMK